MSSAKQDSDPDSKPPQNTQPSSSLDGFEHIHDGPSRGQNALFFPATKMVAKGFGRPLQHDDLWRLHQDERTKSIWKTFKPAWKKQQAKKDPGLFGALSATFKWPLIAAFFLFLLQSALSFTTPVMLPYVIEWLITNIPNQTEIARNFTASPAFIAAISAPIAAAPPGVVAPPTNSSTFPTMNFTLPPFDWTQFIPPSVPPAYIDLAVNGPRPAWEGWIYMAVAGGTQLLMGFLNTHGFFLTWRTGLKIRVVLINLIYRKSLYMAPNKTRDSGAITNLINTDAQLMSETIGFVVLAFLAPFQIAGCVILLARQLGNYAMIPVAAFVIAVPFGGIFGRRLGNLRLKIQAITDMRVRKVKEFITANRIVKYYAWENPIAASVAAVRLAELGVLKTMTLTANVMMFVLLNMPPIGIGLTFFFYGLNNTLTPSLVFTSLSLVNLLRVPFIVLPFAVNNIFNYIASVKRIMDFLSKPELPRERTVEDTPAPPVKPKKHHKKHKKSKHGDEDDEKEAIQSTDDIDWILKIQNGSFKWSPTDQRAVLQNINMTVSRGQVLMVVGAVGSGKSSLGMAILGELCAVDNAGNPIPTEAQQPLRYRSSSIAYVAQEAWIINGSVRENILFGLPFDAEKYERTLKAACLGPDLQIMSSGDQTLIGDRGINLSGGQRQRVSIARALYADKDVYLLDDPLSAVDVHVGQAIFELAITELLIRAGKTVILITNQLQYLPRADMIYMLKKGKVSETGTFTELMAQKGAFAQLINEFGVFNEEKTKQPKKEADKSKATKEKVTEVKSEASSSSGKVVSEPKSPDVKAATSQKEEKAEEEERETGPIPFRVFTFFWKQGGAFNTAFILFFSALKLACQIGGYVWLANWSTDMSTSQLSGAATKYTATVYLWVYLGFLLGESVFSFGGMFGFVLWGVRASKRLHKFLLRAVLRATCAFFDYTPIGRLMSRFSKDMSVIDFFLTAQTEQSLFAALNLLAIIANFLSGSLWLLLIMVPCLIIYFFVYYIYRHSAVEMQRLEAISRAPVLSNLSETLEGAATIRAYGMIRNFKQRAVNSLDENSVDWLGLRYTMTWLTLTLDWLGAFVVAIVYLVIVIMRIQGNLDVGLGALALSSTAGFSFLLSQIATTVGDMEIKMNAVERINQYILNVPQEPADIIEGNRPPAAWPEKGRVQFDDLKLAYSADAGMTTFESTTAKTKKNGGAGADDLEKREPVLVLRGINASIKAKEKVGIVGRTGAGKSTLVSALFRLVEFAGGKLNIDKVNISEIGLFDLRKHLSIVPQQPTLFMGTVRYNLDPFNECSDEDLWRVLEQVRLKEYVTSMEGQLDATVEENGQNFSVGQRQLLAMARALLRDSRILILDEATAAVDSESDMLIQRMIREDISGDKTVLTIAHRLNTIMDSDRIMVLDKGKVVEFDSPKTLLSNPDGVFTSMVNATGEATAKHLRAVAFGEISVLDALKESQRGIIQKKPKSTKTPAPSDHVSRKDKSKTNKKSSESAEPAEAAKPAREQESKPEEKRRQKKGDSKKDK